MRNSIQAPHGFIAWGTCFIKQGNLLCYCVMDSIEKESLLNLV